MNLPLKDITETTQQVTHKVWPLTGGVHPEENKHQSTGKPISKAAIPERLILPLSQHAGAPAEPIVAIGDKVLKGQMIAKAVGFVSVPVHAPTSGIVTAIDVHSIPHPSGMSDTCITIETDGKDEWCELKPIENHLSVEPSILVEHVRQSGIAGMGGAGFPTAVKLSPRSAIDTLILNGTECEPYITADDMLMRERADQIVSGASILMHLLKAKQCLIGIEDNKPEAVAAMKQATASNSTMSVAVFPTKYPSGGEKQLIQILTGQEVPSGKLPSDLGIAMQNVGTAAAVHQAVIHGKPLISRVTTLTGDALGDKKNLEVLLGTSVAELLKEANVNDRQLNTLVMGGPMMGFTLDDLTVPVVKTTNCLIAGSIQEFPASMPAQACIRCGMCAEVCPSSLLPQQLYWHAKAENLDQLKHHNLFDCIECGACSFVCPSSIPLVQYYRASKGTIRIQEAKNAKADRSKVRYESRQARLEQDQAEKEAKRKANAKKAAVLKAARESKSDIGSAEVDPVKAAIERAKAKKLAGGTSQPVKAVLSSEQKELKIQLSVANAQSKKIQRALAQVEASGEGDTTKLKSDIAILQAQAEKLQKEFDAAATASPEPSAKPPASADLKKLKVENAMAKAALKKAERALVKAQDENGDTVELQKTVDECRQKLENLTSLPVTGKPVAADRTKPVSDDQLKKLKIENAMAKAALKKAQRALDAADGDKAALETVVAEAGAKADAAAKELADHLA